MRNDEGRWFLTGDFQIPGDLEPGNYAMEVVTDDRMANPKRQAAEQWADLTIAK